jgi:hypothetical protein
MTEQPNKRDAAIKGFLQREADAARASSEKMRAKQEEARHQEANLTTWLTRAARAISTGIIQLSDDFARRGSPFIIRQRPDSRRGAASFEIHRSGSLPTEASLEFILQPDGLVRAKTDARGVNLPDDVAVDAVTPEWAERAAEEVMCAAVLDGQRIPVPDDDFMKGGFQTRVPVQPRSGRSHRR